MMKKNVLKTFVQLIAKHEKTAFWFSAPSKSKTHQKAR